MLRTCTFGVLFPALCSWGQLVPSGAKVPRTGKPPVVFINGYQNLCPVSFGDTFGIADQVLQANGQASLFFSTCSLPLTASIEELGAALGQFISGLTYEDGQPVDLVDVVAHSMGGLVLRSYLCGKQNSAGQFDPPATTHIRRAVFLATPHFGTSVALLAGFTAQLQELGSGSRFLFDLATWNQGTDDMRGVDALSVAGNAGSGLAVMPGFDDGVVALSSASLRFYMPGRTRVVPYCHVDPDGLVGLAGLCPQNTAGIAKIRSASHPAAQVITSFLNGTDLWKAVGTAAENDPFLSIDGGLDVAVRASDDRDAKPAGVDATTGATTKHLNISSDGLAYTDLFPAGQVTLVANSTAGIAGQVVTLAPGGTQPFVLKPGPRISRILPAAAATFPLTLAPGMFIAIYGAALAANTAQANGLPFPAQLSDAQVLVDGSPIPLYYVSAVQIDAVLPETAASLLKLTVRNSAGSNTVNVLLDPAVPEIFTLDAPGTGPAAALTSANYQVVSADNPLHAGDFLELFATGLGRTSRHDGLDYAVQQPTVTIAGKNCPVTYAGRAPGYAGLDQINCIVPSGIPASPNAPVVVTSGNRSSNVATLAVQ